MVGVRVSSPPRPLLAISFVLSLILFSWWVAWKTVLAYVPAVQEICGLRKKPKPASRHSLSLFYNSMPARRSNTLREEGKSSKFLQNPTNLYSSTTSGACWTSYLRSN